MARSWRKGLSGLECPECDAEVENYVSRISRTQGGGRRTRCTNCETFLRLNIELVGTVVETEVEKEGRESSETDEELVS